jgi:hypothetical protein
MLIGMTKAGSIERAEIEIFFGFAQETNRASLYQLAFIK